MPLKTLRPGRSEQNLKRRSTLNPSGFFRRVDKDSADHLPPDRAAVSYDGGRPTTADLAPHDTAFDAHHDPDQRPPSEPPSPPVQRPTPNTRRFSLMRFRHASDSQLNAKAKEHAARDDTPPVPAVPASTAPPTYPDAPAIITTAPTVVDQETEQSRKRGRLQQFTLRRRSFDPSLVDRPTAHKPMDKKRGPLGLKKSHGNLLEERERQAAADPRESTDGAPALVLPVTRASESSRSDGSSGGHVSFEQTPRPHQPPRMGSARFGFGRRKQRASLFPLPMKVDSPQYPNAAPDTPRLSTGGRSSASPTRSSTGSPPPTAHRVQEGEPGPEISPMPSSDATLLNPSSPRPGSLYRNGSTASVRSARSSKNAGMPVRLGLRGRSSTMGSLGGRSDGATSPTPPNGPSGRTSTSTVGRSSFSNLFGLSSRFRQGSDPHSSRHGSPALGLMGASGLSSHQNSFNMSRETLILPEREEGETPGRYLERIEANNFNKSVVASYLSKTEDPFLLSVLRSYMRKFAFFGDPIDMAIRKLLMQVELPKETQQIDRVLQGFSDRYHECNPGIYINPDKAYFISFSIVILHTDVFNKNNKRKMQRPDYIKNSSCEGVSDDALGCIYDNVVYTPFIHIEDDVDLRTISSKKSRKTILKGPMNDPVRKSVKEPLDPYTLIFEGKLDALRPSIKDVMNLDDPYSYLGTAATLDTKNIYKSFSRYGVIQIVSSRSRPEAYMSEAAQENPLGTSVGIVEMPVTKVGILWRKDAKRKKARSPWQEWGAVLTRSGLSLFRNSTWARSLMNQHEQHQKRDETGPVVFQPPLQHFKQDNVIPMDGAVCLVDNTYRKHKNAFVMYSKAGEETFLADSESDLNEWLGVLNYTAAFETLGVRSRGMVGGLYEGQTNRGMRRLHSSHSGMSVPTPTGEVTIQTGGIDNQFAQQMMTARKELMQQRISESEEKLAQAIRELEARLRDARHLQILAPIQPKTREMVIHAAGRLAAKLKWSRIQIWRMKCHRDILAQELEDERQSDTERQARNDRIAETSQQPQPQLPPLSPQPSHKTSKSPLAKLSSKTSLFANAQKPPLSPESPSIRPGTKSSRDTDFDEDMFKTPPETSQSSPTFPIVQTYVPISFAPATSDRRSSVASSAQSPRMYPSDHRPSVSTTNDGTIGSDDDSDTGSRYATPPPTAQSELMELRTPDIYTTDGAHADPDAISSEADMSLAALSGSPTSRSKQRRSLHRTLRDSHGSSSHRRSQKGRDSASTILSDDTQESEGLMRSKGSFTVHGKKASVIQFGPDWHITTPEERLKTIKQLQEAAAVDDRDGIGFIPDGMALSPGLDAGEEYTPRRLSAGVVKQRHISAQTITPASFLETLDAHQQRVDEDGGGSELGDIAEEPPRASNDVVPLRRILTPPVQQVDDH
ncbi:protein transport protein sec73 [Dothidotthia symphoricarpi CBS 119687]|uniref:Protein transport protein sec73 n=1 Tax=Dothidotthia symphoricarpi CBS 119687 TaxID=1392245 RepID=A0A6A6A2D3_9PLEO|nr:protein transport protein sec73 [Dothidotthia symphoricarpi CBS 119687]KAF2126009.1 protein transport protein sec73 [Dothidotthia symphoricarpi CBS 119687]